MIVCALIPADIVITVTPVSHCGSFSFACLQILNASKGYLKIKAGLNASNDKTFFSDKDCHSLIFPCKSSHDDGSTGVNSNFNRKSFFR